jgi:hypothetical protein
LKWITSYFHLVPALMQVKIISSKQDSTFEQLVKDSCPCKWFSFCKVGNLFGAPISWWIPKWSSFFHADFRAIVLATCLVPQLYRGYQNNVFPYFLNSSKSIYYALFFSISYTCVISYYSIVNTSTLRVSRY